MKAKATIDLQGGEEGIFALFAACEHGRLECAQLLLDAKATVDQQRDGGYSSLYCSSEYGQLDCARLLLESNATVDLVTDHGGLLMIAAHNGHAPLVQLLLDAKASTTAHLGKLDATAPNRAVPGPRRVHSAARPGRTCAAAAGAGAERHPSKPAKKKRASLNAKLISDSALGDRLVDATLRDDITLLKRLLKSKALDINYKRAISSSDKDSYTALAAACFCGNLRAAGLLLKAKAAVDQPTKRKKTPLIIAALDGHAPIVRLLLDVKASATARWETGQTALECARRYGHAACVSLLDPDGPAPPSPEPAPEERHPPKPKKPAAPPGAAATAAEARAVEHRREAGGAARGEPPQAAEGAARGENDRRRLSEGE